MFSCGLFYLKNTNILLNTYIIGKTENNKDKIVADDSKDLKLKAFVKEQVRKNLLKVGRKLVVEKGVDFLTARKLAEASGISIGSIYNQFATMDNFILEQNIQTLDEMYGFMSILIPDTNAFANLNRYVDAFSAFIINNPNLWNLLFKMHINSEGGALPFRYVKRIKRIQGLFDRQIGLMFKDLDFPTRRLSGQVLEMTLFALSGFLASKSWDNLRQVNKQNICKLLLSTFLAGINSLKKVK